MEPTDRSYYDPRIDVIRACACGMVATLHFSVPTWSDHLAEPGFIFDTVAIAIIQTGWLGVPLFLFISGYSLALNKTHKAYDLNKKQFFINRVLRIFPVWIMCILILTTHFKLSGINVFTLLLMQTQDIPPLTAFGIAWSLQLEFMCYLMFPVFLAAIIEKRNLLPFFAFFLLIRIWVFYTTTSVMWAMSYSTLFGGGTIFLAGMITASFRPMSDKGAAKIFLAAGILLFCAVAVFINKSGGWQNPRGTKIHWFYTFMPEILSGIFYLIVRGSTTSVSNSASKIGAAGIPSFRTAITSTHAAFFNALAHFGRVSYSGYIFSLYTLNFTERVFAFIKPTGWLSLVAALIPYYVCLTVFATVSFYAIELPFLRMRRRYVHSVRPSGGIDRGGDDPTSRAARPEKKTTDFEVQPDKL